MADKKYTVRIPEELHAELERAAKEDMRSLHSQILVMLREAVARRPKPRGETPGTKTIPVRTLTKDDSEAQP